MEQDEKQYLEELKAEGVEIDEEIAEEKEEASEEEETKTPQKEESEDDPKKIDKEGESEESENSTLQDQKEFKKRSIYDNYKAKKAELKTEKELREQAESELAELRQKVDAFENAKTKDDKVEALDDIESFAKEIGADPAAVKKMKALFLKDLQSQVPESVLKDIEEVKAWKAENAKALEAQQFEEEFNSVLPQIKADFPQASDSEIKAIKSELDKLSHSKEFHDKSMDYVVFKNKDVLSALVSPKKKGMETKERKDVEEETFEFDPDADISKMTPKQLEHWERQYNKATSEESLVDDGRGGKVLV